MVVVVQYRLGALGFLSSGDNTLPGAYGMMMTTDDDDDDDDCMEMEDDDDDNNDDDDDCRGGFPKHKLGVLGFLRCNDCSQPSV